MDTFIPKKRGPKVKANVCEGYENLSAAERKKAYSRWYRSTHKEEIKANFDRYMKDNKPRMTEYVKNYRKKKRMEARLALEAKVEDEVKNKDEVKK
ncbi:MAG: hypothetical protein KAS12_04210 [Candidatus Aenigmarchaeota archaeon]|nr:hypothetical protein [Candidatus Aenigmarchaeota archaeon]